MKGEQRWIPCSERLPEMGSTVLMQNTGGWMFVATYAVTPKRKYWAVLEHDYALDEAIAWMPLPEPYDALLPSTQPEQGRKEENNE